MPDEATAAHRSADTPKQHSGKQGTNDHRAGASPTPEAASSVNEWAGFAPGRWQHAIDVRDFIQRNVTPYDGDEGVLVAPSERTKAVWDKLQPYFKEEIRKGVLDVDT